MKLMDIRGKKKDVVRGRKSLRKGGSSGKEKRRNSRLVKS